MDLLVQEAVNNSLKNKLFGLLRERERDREWIACLEAIQIELMGVPEEERTINYYHLCWKINSLRYLSFPYFRTTIFDCMTILTKMTNA